ncbi:MAG: ATP-dependent helicase HrpB [Pseudomonadota bacterium]
MADLPIDSLLPEICETLKLSRRLVLAAPPGAGKTSRVPLALAGYLGGQQAVSGKVLVLEPRRIAARMAAERMASTLGERVGQRVGLSTRIERRVSKDTAIEVMTDGLFIRRILADPELTGIGAVVFDEVHERGLNTDLGLALCLDVQKALREDLHLLAMSATLDTETFSIQLDAPVVESEGRQYPVETRYLGRTRDRLEDQMAKAIQRAHRETDGSILAFLPGAGEIRRTAERLEGLSDTLVAPLYGAMSPKDQDAAVKPRPDGGRKIVLATDLAESALTIEGVSVVVDSGMARVPEVDPAGISTKLVTIRAARANVDQRRGRAGRLGPGICYRLWDEAETRGLVAAPTPEIIGAELSGLLLTLADWGETNPLALSWIDAPPSGRINAARDSLLQLGALDAEGRLTAKGKAMADLPLPPRLAALIVGAETPGEKALAAQIAALMGEAGMGGSSADLAERLTRFGRETSARAKSLRRQAERWAEGATPSGNPAHVLAKGWPDRIAKRRGKAGATYVMASGRAGQLDEASRLAKSDWLVVADLVGAAKGGRITLAGALDPKTAQDLGHVETRDEAAFDPATGKFKGRRVKAIGAIILSETPLPKPSDDVVRAGYLSHLREHGFGPTGLKPVIAGFCARLAALRGVEGEKWPDDTPNDLQETVEDWLKPMLGTGRFDLPSHGTVLNALKAALEWPLPQEIDKLAPLRAELPCGRKAEIDWLDERAPLVECRVQELYGAQQHPSLINGRVPITLQMLSPGGKPVATTRDLPGFWAGGYGDMAKDMRGRYPKHDWPEDPASAKPHAGMTKARLARS